MISTSLLQRCRSAVVVLAGHVRTYLVPYRRPIVVVTHLLATMATNYLAFWLRFDGDIPARERELWWAFLPWLVATRAVSFFPSRLYQGLWRYTSLWDLRNLMLGVLGGSFAFYGLVRWVWGAVEYPRSVFLIDAMLLFLVLGGLRLLPRVYRDFFRHGSGTRILIFGAGDAGETIVRDMLKQPDYHPVGFLDDDKRKVGMRIHGVRVFGTRADLPRAIAMTRPDEVLVAVSRRETELVQDLVRVLQPFKVKITTLPALRELINGEVAVSQIRSLSIEDLLARPAIGLDDRPVQALIEGRCVMVTGAGGSIGSELCRQIASFKPSRLLLFERYENSLYAIANELLEHFPEVRCETLIGDITDVGRLDAVLATHRPSLVLHAAAHKHVPLMEHNCCEAVKNNVYGTLALGEAAQRHGVERFILISSDKAVNPSSIMGATKRVAELCVQALAARGGTRFAVVRFGNVLGSNGSVVPRFLSQIQAGGPVTVTHPEMERYFMLISEAVQLVLHAAALGDETRMYVLDMGAQIKLVALAQNLIRLSGFVPDKEIKIEFIGLRPGEKLSEELTSADEVLQPSSVGKVFVVKAAPSVAVAELAVKVHRLIRLAHNADGRRVVSQLQTIIPTFVPDPGLLERLAEPAVYPLPPRQQRKRRPTVYRLDQFAQRGAGGK